MKKTHKILAIPIQKVIETNEYQSLIYKWKDKYYSCYDCIFSLEEAIPQQLLLLSDEEIKEDDWAIDFKQNNLIWQHTQGGVVSRTINDRYKKIIASYPQLDNLPTFSKEFIQEWCKNPIEKAEVEYEELYSTSMYAYSNELRLKLTLNNEVICYIPKCDCMEITCNICEPKINKRILEDAKNKVMMNKTIELAAKEYFDSLCINQKSYLYPTKGFIAGAKSEAAKTFHTKGMYTEEEVKRLCSEAYVKSPDDHDNMIEYFEKWFDKNKKK